MNQSGGGSFRLFRVFGIDVYLSWTWFLVIYFVYRIAAREIDAGSVTDALPMMLIVLKHLIFICLLFAIVLLHEFGHALACRQVGGRAERILLWPLGGVAYVKPPNRPGPVLWSIAAGPLVNFVLMIILGLVDFGVVIETGSMERANALHSFMRDVEWTNAALLVFNLIPVYPLDGGQIFRALLWFVIGPAKSLMTAAAIGIVAALILVAMLFTGGSQLTDFFGGSWWTGFVSIFVLFSSWQGFEYARKLNRISKARKRTEFSCPGCKLSPPEGPFWVCDKCFTRHDTFENYGLCPHCSEVPEKTACPHCGESFPIDEWYEPVNEPPPLPPPLPKA